MTEIVKTREISKDLRTRFIEGEKLTVKELVEDYFAPKSPYSYLVAERAIRRILHGVKYWLRKNHGIWFGNIDDNGRYGIIETEPEARYAMIRYYRFVKGVLFNANLLTANAKEKGLLPSNIITEKFLVAKIEEEEKKKNGN